MATVNVTGAGQTPHERVRVGAVELHRVTMEEVCAGLVRAVGERTLHQVVTVNLQFLGYAFRNPEFARVVNQASLVVADGMPAIWLSRLSGFPIQERITGHELLDACAGLAQRNGYSLFLLGGGSGAGEEAAKRLCARFPGLRIAGVHQGRFSESGFGTTAEEEERAIAAIREARPDFLFVGLGCGKQEFWIHHHLQAIEVPVCVGVGGVLDVLAGRVTRAPRWMQRTGLEWSYRLLQEPRRLWKRYLLQDAPIAVRLAASALRGRFSGHAHSSKKRTA